MFSSILSLLFLEHSLNFLRFQPCPIRHSERESRKKNIKTGRVTAVSAENFCFLTMIQSPNPTYCSVRFSRQIFSMHSRNVLSLQKSFGRVGDELTLSSRNRMMKIMAKIARNVVDIFSDRLFTGLTTTEILNQNKSDTQGITNLFFTPLFFLRT